MTENLLKAKTILKKALNSIAHARACISKSDKTFLCDKDYDDDSVNHDAADNPTKSSTNPKKYLKLKNLKEKLFEHKKEAQSDSVSNLIADVHVELIYIFHKISMKVLGVNKESNAQNMKPKYGMFHGNKRKS